MKITEDFLSLGKRARGSSEAQIKFTGPVKAIIIHWIGPYLHTPKAVRDWWEYGVDGWGVQASTHFIVKDKTVLQALPLDEVGWHSGDARNWHSIGIEVCPESINGKFSTSSIKTLAKLVAHIKSVHSSIEIIERHYDGEQKKDCPRYYTPVTIDTGVEGRVENPEGGEDRWQELLENIAGEKDSPSCLSRVLSSFLRVVSVLLLLTLSPTKSSLTAQETSLTNSQSLTVVWDKASKTLQTELTELRESLQTALSNVIQSKSLLSESTSLLEVSSTRIHALESLLNDTKEILQKKTKLLAELVEENHQKDKTILKHKRTIAILGGLAILLAGVVVVFVLVKTGVIKARA